jgi:hypothetical protein
MLHTAVQAWLLAAARDTTWRASCCSGVIVFCQNESLNAMGSSSMSWFAQ